jgi:hypothetical protein
MSIDPRPAGAGYSGTPLARKLGLRPGAAFHAPNAPSHYAALLDPLPEGARLAARWSAGVDFVHLFVDRRADLAAALVRWRERLPSDGTLWISWPKKASKVPTDITEDTVRELALPLGWVDVKVCAVDDVWSGLKLVVRKELR